MACKGGALELAGSQEENRMRMLAIALAALLVACDAPTGMDTPSAGAPGKCQGRGCTKPDPTPTFPDPDSVTIHPNPIVVAVGDSASFRVVMWWGGAPYVCAGETARQKVVVGERNGAWDVVGEGAQPEAWPCDFSLEVDDPTVASVEKRWVDMFSDFASAVGLRLAQAWGKITGTG